MKKSIALLITLLFAGSLYAVADVPAWQSVCKTPGAGCTVVVETPGMASSGRSGMCAFVHGTLECVPN